MRLRAFFLLWLLAGVAQAQQIVHIVVPFAAGGVQDILARTIAPDLGQLIGRNVIVENRLGASGTIANAVVAKSAPDGNTLLLAAASHTITGHVYAKLPYHPIQDFTAVAHIGTVDYVLMVNPAVPAKTVAEFIAYAKANPGKINYAAAGISTLNTLAMEQFRHRLGLQMTQVPYKGGAGPAIIDLLAGNVDVMFVTLSSAAQFVKAGKLKAFAVTTKERVESLPELPTVVELGFPEDVSGSWQGLFAVAGTPQPIVAKLHAAVLKAMADPDVCKHMVAASMVPTSSPTPGSFKDFVTAESAKWRQVVEQIKAAENGKSH